MDGHAQPGDIYAPVKECIVWLRQGKETLFIAEQLRQQGKSEAEIRGIIRQAEEVWYMMRMARKKIIEGSGIALLSIGGSVASFYTGGNWIILLYGAAALGLGMIFWGFFMKSKTKHYL